jgi:hypothetical protein
VSDFTVTVHALERIEERWPDFFCEMSDDQIAVFIQSEVIDAFESGRVSNVPPVEFSSINIGANHQGGSQTCWNADKDRGYVFREDEDGLVVMTVSRGQPRHEALGKLRNDIVKKIKLRRFR